MLLGTGLVGMLALNGALAADSFRQRALQQQVDDLQLREQQLRRQVDALQAPAALAEAAQKLGMVPSGDPAFVVFRADGSHRVLGAPTPATAPAPRPTPAPQPAPAAPAAPAAGATGGGNR